MTTLSIEEKVNILIKCYSLSSDDSKTKLQMQSECEERRGDSCSEQKSTLIGSTMKPSHLKQLCNELIESLRTIDISTRNRTSLTSYFEKLYIDGEPGSNQTAFETMSNHLKIGVKANSDCVGYSLLAFLRMIIDERFDLLATWIEDYLEEHKRDNINVAGILMEILSKQETAYSDKYSLGRPEITRMLKGFEGSKIITKAVSEIDIWSFERIAKYIDSKEFKDKDVKCIN
jgi:hypothetical protein